MNKSSTPFNAKPDLWSCPKCGHQFVTKNIWHSCANFDLDHHFAGKDPVVNKLYEQFRRMVERCGPVIQYPQKSRIVFMRRMRFASCQTRKNWLKCGLILEKERAGLETLLRIEKFSDRSFGHYFRVENSEDLNSAFMELIREAYRVGGQEIRRHVSNRLKIPKS